MKRLLVVFLLSVPVFGQHRSQPSRALTWCAEDGDTFSLKDFPDESFVAYVGTDGHELRGKYADNAGESANLTLIKDSKKVDEFQIDDLTNPNGWTTRSEGNKRFAVTWSNGGATGDWATRVFSFSAEGKLVENKDVVRVVEKEFAAHHTCRTRGNNYTAIKWLDADRLLIDAEVHPTSDCGKQMGFTLGYVVNVVSALIERRLSYQQMIDLPFVCTQNVIGPK